MDILIKNMEMPKSCITGKIPDYEYCPFFGSCSKANAKTERPSDCPLVALPEHGRLIDADALQKELAEHGYPSEREWYFAEVGQFIDEAETIVEATE